MVNKKKRYVATLSNELEASYIYDKVAIQFHGGRVSCPSFPFLFLTLGLIVYRQRQITLIIRSKFSKYSMNHHYSRSNEVK
jgi:hypothetical protein